MIDSYVAEANSLQIEISTKCNAQCPSCIRTDSTSLVATQEVIPRNKEMSLSDFSKIVSSQFAKKLQLVEFCGTLDEPLMHSQFFEILDLIRLYCPTVSVQIHTNGGLRNRAYFSELANRLKSFGPQSCVKFSIDGLEDTNGIYRHGVDFKKAFQNLEAFITSGGRAEWQMLIFPWNQHQVEQVKALSQKIGCVAFKARPDRTAVSTWGAEKIQSIREKNLMPISGLRRGDPQSLTFIEENLAKPVHCVYKDVRKMIFISWDALVWPCCFWTNIRYENELKKNLLQKTVYDQYGEFFNSLKNASLDEILQHRFFTKELLVSWREGSPLKWRCVDKCSVAKTRASDGKVDDKKPYSYEEFNQ